MSRAGPGAAAVPEGGGGASAGGCQSPGLFLTRLLRLRAQVPARSCSPLRPGVSRPTKSLSRVPETRPGHRGSVQAPVVPQPSSQCVCPSLPAPRKPPQRAAGGPQPPAPPWGAPLASVGVPVPASAGQPASPSVGAAVLGVRSGRGAESGWWAQGRGINGLPRPGPRSERAWSPPQTNGGPGPPHLPRRPGLPRPRATVQAKKSWCGGGGGAEIGLLYFGTSDKLEKPPAPCKEPEGGRPRPGRASVGSLGAWLRLVPCQGPHRDFLGTDGRSYSSLFPF